MKNTPRPQPTRLWLIVFGVALLLAVFGWFAAPNNPRDGWSLVAITTGRAPAAGSGDRAYLIAGPAGRFAFAPIETDAESTHGWVLVRRERVGLFVPWLETENLRIAAVSGKHPHWQSGSADPTWHQALRSARGWYVERGTAWHQRVVDAIDAELRGAYPDRRIRAGALGLELIFLGAHAVLLFPALLMIHLWLKRQYAEGYLRASAA